MQKAKAEKDKADSFVFAKMLSGEKREKESEDNKEKKREEKKEKESVRIERGGITIEFDAGFASKPDKVEQDLAKKFNSITL